MRQRYAANQLVDGGYRSAELPAPQQQPTYHHHHHHRQNEVPGECPRDVTQSYHLDQWTKLDIKQDSLSEQEIEISQIVLSAVVAVALAKPGYLGAGVAAPAVAAVPGIAAAVQPAPVFVGGIHPGLAAYGPANIVVGPGGYNLNTPDVAAARGAHLKTVSAIKRISADPDVDTERPRPVGTRQKDGCGTFTRQRPTHCSPPVYKLVFCGSDVHCSSADSSRQQQTPTTDTMKCLIVLSAVVAMALAKPGYLGAGVVAPAVAAAPGIAAAVQPAPVLVGGIHPGLAAYGPANIVVGPGGYNLDTADVAAARAAHLTAVAQTRVRDAAITGAALAVAYGAYAAPAVVAAPAVAAVAPAAYAAPSAALLAAKAAYHG
ncbi:uncharacterized protein LOC124789209 [Schistocerca piceifrons]|uniref:uncharacterized protein LOC124789209 n=1 Tax=Schistocerca piceifrons TaxID=274613 RepID=UPI001F5FE1C9|nr:uncharacterized protein LOC124789209 [Schistocerca piceifrons]